MQTFDRVLRKKRWPSKLSLEIVIRPNWGNPMSPKNGNPPEARREFEVIIIVNYVHPCETIAVEQIGIQLPPRLYNFDMTKGNETSSHW